MSLSLEVTCAAKHRVELDFAEQIGAELVDSDGPCALLFCAEDGPHKHAICPTCGAVKFGNIYCDTCRQCSQLEHEELERLRARAEVERIRSIDRWRQRAD